MVYYESSYVKWYRSFLLFFGMWPYDNSQKRTVKRVLTFLVQISFIIAQICRLFTNEISFDILSDTLPIALICMHIITKCVIFWTTDERYKDALEHMQTDCVTLTDAETIDYLRETYTQFTIYLSIFLATAYTVSLGAWLIPFVSPILDLINPLNESRPNCELIHTEYFVDREKYVYLILFHSDVAVFLMSSVHIACDTLNCMILLHIKGVFNVIGYYTMHVFDKPDIGNEKIDETLLHHKRLICVVNLHRRNLKLCDIFMNCMLESGIAQTTFATLCITGILVQLNNVISPIEDGRLVLCYASLLFVYMSTLFVNIQPAQKIYESSEELFFKIYCADWYTAPLESQKLQLFLMHKFMSPCKLKVKNVMYACNELYAKIVQVAFSYFMVLHSTQA